MGRCWKVSRREGAGVKRPEALPRLQKPLQLEVLLPCVGDFHCVPCKAVPPPSPVGPTILPISNEPLSRSSLLPGSIGSWVRWMIVPAIM